KSDASSGDSDSCVSQQKGRSRFSRRNSLVQRDRRRFVIASESVIASSSRCLLASAASRPPFGGESAVRDRCRQGQGVMNEEKQEMTEIGGRKFHGASRRGFLKGMAGASGLAALGAGSTAAIFNAFAARAARADVSPDYGALAPVADET